MYALLENSSDAEERLAILREIRRLSETVENLEQQLATMRERIAFSRVAVRLTARMETGANHAAGFHLSDAAAGSFRCNSGEPWKRRALTGRQFCRIQGTAGRRGFLCGKCRRRSTPHGSVRNEPAGDGLFWQTAMLNYLAPLYAQVTAVNL